MLKFRGTQLYRKELYTTISLLFGIGLFGALVNDFIATLSLESPETSTHNLTFLVLFMHCVSTTMAMIGCIYNGLSDQVVGFYMGMISSALNITMFIIRISLEIEYWEFRPEELAHSQ